MLKVIRQRHSIRSYQNKPVEDEKVEEILKAAQFAPSANHRCPWEFVVVDDPRTKENLSRATPWGSFISQAPVVIVVCSDEEKSREWLEDASIVGAHIYLEATNQGLGTCWVQVRGSQTESSQDSESYVRQLLNIPNSFRVVAIFPIGYPAEEKPEHIDEEVLSEKIHKNKW